MITYTRFLDTQLFQSDPGAGDAGYMAYFTSAVLDPSIITINVNQSWDEYIGFYVFLKTAPAPADMDKFASALTAYFAEHYPSQIGRAHV